MKLTAIRLENIRVFDGEHVIPIAGGLTVLMGRNNAGKSSALRAPFLLLSPNHLSNDVFQRRGARAGAVGLLFRFETGDAELAEFPDSRVKELRVGERGGHWPVPLGNLPAFGEFAASPAVEIRAAFQNNTVSRAVRLVGNTPNDWIEITKVEHPSGEPQA